MFEAAAKFSNPVLRGARVLWENILPRGGVLQLSSGVLAGLLQPTHWSFHARSRLNVRGNAMPKRRKPSSITIRTQRNIQ